MFPLFPNDYFCTMESKFEELMCRILPLFMRLGIRSLTMDDIAKELSISKKTIYKYVSDKSDLVNKAMEMMCKFDQYMADEITKNSKNAIDEIIGISQHANEKLQMIHPSLHFDLEKYYPTAWETFNNHKLIFIRDKVKGNIERGIKEGLYRKNLDSFIVATIYTAKIDMIFDPDIFPPTKYAFKDVHMEFVRYHIRGIASEKGIDYLTDIIKQENFDF
jgi:TetR/AcrR family transcriptional regulator, cholesterol catabolism regulator